MFLRDRRAALVYMGMSWFATRHCSGALAGIVSRRTRARAWCFTCLVVTSLALLAGIARSAPIPPVQATTAPPIQIINTNAGRVMMAHAKQYEDKVYISGLVYRPPGPSIGAHVHVWGVDKNNNRVFVKTTSVQFTGSPSFNRTTSYIVSISPYLIKKTKVIYVTFHNLSHADSREGM